MQVESDQLQSQAIHVSLWDDKTDDDDGPPSKLTILLAFQNCTTLMTFFKKQMGPVMTAKIWGQVICFRDHTIKLVHPGNVWMSFQAFSGWDAVVPSKVRTIHSVHELGRSGVE